MSLTTNKASLEDGLKMSLADSESLMMAFAATSQASGLSVSNPRYVRWYTQVWSFLDGKSSIEYYPLHSCTEEEFAKFSPADSKSTSDSVA